MSSSNSVGIRSDIVEMLDVGEEEVVVIWSLMDVSEGGSASRRTEESDAVQEGRRNGHIDCEREILRSESDGSQRCRLAACYTRRFRKEFCVCPSMAQSTSGSADLTCP